MLLGTKEQNPLKIQVPLKKNEILIPSIAVEHVSLLQDWCLYTPPQTCAWVQCNKSHLSMRVSHSSESVNYLTTLATKKKNHCYKILFLLNFITRNLYLTLSHIPEFVFLSWVGEKSIYIIISSMKRITIMCHIFCLTQLMNRRPCYNLYSCASLFADRKYPTMSNWIWNLKFIFVLRFTSLLK